MEKARTSALRRGRVTPTFTTRGVRRSAASTMSGSLRRPGDISFRYSGWRRRKSRIACLLIVTSRVT